LTVRYTGYLFGPSCTRPPNEILPVAGSVKVAPESQSRQGRASWRMCIGLSTCAYLANKAVDYCTTLRLVTKERLRGDGENSRHENVFIHLLSNKHMYSI